MFLVLFKLKSFVNLDKHSQNLKTNLFYSFAMAFVGKNRPNFIKVLKGLAVELQVDSSQESSKIAREGVNFAFFNILSKISQCLLTGLSNQLFQVSFFRQCLIFIFSNSFFTKFCIVWLFFFCIYSSSRSTVRIIWE